MAAPDPTVTHPLILPDRSRDSSTVFLRTVFDPARIAAYLGVAAGKDDTVICGDCWFGREARAPPGARIGDGVTIGARAVVVGTIPGYAVVAGDPGRVIRMWFEEADRARFHACA